MKKVKRGDIYYADLSPVVGSEQGGKRPVIVVQNNTGNEFSPTVIVAVLTSKLKNVCQHILILFPARAILQWILRCCWSKSKPLIRPD